VIEILKTVTMRCYKTLAMWLLRPMLRHEWKVRSRRRINERPIEYAYALKWISRTCPSEVLDVGSGATAWPQVMADCGLHVTGIDEKRAYWKGGFFNRHYLIIDDDITATRLVGSFDLITCISVLEHIPDHAAAVAGMCRLLRPGGRLLLTFPYNERRYVSNVYDLPASGYGKDYPFICQVFSRKECDEWLKDNAARLVDEELYEVFSGELWTFGERIYPPRESTRTGKHHLACVLLEKLDERPLPARAGEKCGLAPNQALTRNRECM